MLFSKRKNRRVKSHLLITTLGALVAFTPALRAVELIQAPSVEDHYVRLSDLFKDLGDAPDPIVMEAPDPGKREVVTGYELSAIAQEHSLEWTRPSYIKRIYLERAGIPFSLDDLEPTLHELVAQNGMAKNIQISVFGRKNSLYLPVGYSLADITYTGFVLNNRANRFSVTVNLPTGGPMPRELKLSGTLQEVQLVPVLNRMVLPGEIITDKDISWENHPVRRIHRNVVTNHKNLVGLAVKRALSPNQLIRSTDVTAPVVVAKGSIVTMTLSRGALYLVAQGRALENGGVGDVIRIMNNSSNQTLEAKVINAENVVIEPTLIQRLAAR